MNRNKSKANSEIKIKFYSICLNENGKHEFDLNYLGDEKLRNIGIAIYSENGKIWGGESTFTPTNQKDYDNEFYQKIFKIEPAYRIFDFLDYHLNYFLNNNEEKEDLFLKHIQYEILPDVKRAIRQEYSELIINWINKRKMDLQKQLLERDEFLRKAYEEAYNYDHSSPLLVSINPIELGTTLSLLPNEVERIVVELLNENLIDCTIGMQDLFVTQKGLNYLRKIEREHQIESSINLNVGNNSNVLFQNKTTHSVQMQNINIVKEDVHKLFELIKKDLKELNDEQSEDLKLEIQNAIKQLEKGKNINSRLLTIGSLIKDIGINVFANLLSSPIFELMKPILGL